MHAPPPGPSLAAPYEPGGPGQAPPQPAGGYGGAPGRGFGPAHGPPEGGGGVRAIVIVLVAVGGVVALIGVLAVLAIYGVRKYIGNAKTAEARNSLGQIAKDAASAYDGDRLPPLGPRSSDPPAPKRRICPSASRPVPLDPTSISGRKYQSLTSEWKVDEAQNAGFACLRFELAGPQYYQYRYDATVTSFTAGARGDLNGDGHFSDFKIAGQIVDTNLVIDPSLLVTDPEE